MVSVVGVFEKEARSGASAVDATAKAFGGEPSRCKIALSWQQTNNMPTN